MDIKTIPLTSLEADLGGIVSECADSGQALVVELPGDRFVAIQPLEPREVDELASDLLESNPAATRSIPRSANSIPSRWTPACGASASAGHSCQQRCIP